MRDQAIGAEDRVRKQLEGVWKLVTWQHIGPDKTVSYPLGPDAVGQLMYDRSGHVSAQLACADQRPFASSDWRRASAREIIDGWPAYTGYFGTFTIDLANHEVVHHIDGAWFPNFVGTAQRRHYAFDGGRLTLEVETAAGRAQLVWARAEESLGVRRE